jgi:predicted nucleic acid-binding protein
VGPSETIRAVIADTSVLINLAHTGHLRLLGGTPGYRFLVPEEVLAELQDAAQREMVEAAISDGVFERTRIESVEELSIYADFTRTLGSGESACLAVASHRGLLLACDERRTFLKEARARIGEHRLINTPGLYVLWIRCQLISVAEADEAKAALERRRFNMKFGSFGELV